MTFVQNFGWKQIPNADDEGTALLATRNPTTFAGIYPYAHNNSMYDGPAGNSNPVGSLLPGNKVRPSCTSLL